MTWAYRYLLPFAVALISLTFLPALLGGWPWPRLILPAALIFVLEDHEPAAWRWVIIGGLVFDIASGGKSSWLLFFAVMVGIASFLRKRFGLHIDSVLGMATLAGLLLVSIVAEALVQRASFGWSWLLVFIGYVVGTLLVSGVLWIVRFSRTYHSRTRIQFM